MTVRRSLLVLAVVVVMLAGAAVIVRQLPEIAAGGLLYPSRRVDLPAAPTGCRDVAMQGAGVELRGWRCPSADPRRATIVYLHGIADNRSSGAGVIQRYVRRGYDVIAYDSRRHGASGGEVCTYGFHERHDLLRVLATIESGPVILFGTSLGAAVALQAAADDPRVAAVIAAEVFSDLRTAAVERAPRLLPSSTIARAFTIAEARGQFRVDDVSPEASARRLKIPVLLIHGDADVDTPPAHSERVKAALAGPSRLLLVGGVGHNQSLSRPAVWDVIDEWMERAAAGTR